MFGRFGSRAVAAVLAVSLALAPLAADARPGRSSSSGSRGSRTYTTPATPSVTGQPIQRSITPPPAAAPAAPAYQPRPAFQQPFAQPGFAQPSFTQRHPFLSGMMGGFLGASLYNSLFGHHGYGVGGDYGSGSGGAFGGFMRLLIMLGIAYLIYRLVRMAISGPRAAPASGMTYELYSPQDAPYQASPFGGSASVPPPAPVPAIGVQMQGQDLSAFEQILTGIMDSWSKGDLTALRRHLTPEMLSYYGEEMTENQSRGIRNLVADVQLVKGDVVESWHEDGRTYCTAQLRWRARDWTVDENTGRVVSGDDRHAEEVQELWTFVRADGGRWLLSAIQQV
ncbi:Tim44 domain-containing protein [Nitrospirillum viridazoti]|uniref:Lipid-binding transport protein (Tim44 family) n=2 Tax=Nitrospirillum TaxID=1543705 RepID=A0A560J540_9PROT|nr:TIM44-like domain-containing protein [Nitrospirillum amazonense]TWB63700.1 putative lipid-binding transport protein (Tim44 family) [Nitrospirillum amazonense]